MTQMRGDCTHGNTAWWTMLRNNFDSTETEFDSKNTCKETEWMGCVRLFGCENRYFSFLGNVLGVSGLPFQKYICGSGGGSCGYYDRHIFSFGDSTEFSTSLFHGNYDFYNKMVYKWEGPDQIIRPSYYLTAKPNWWDHQGAGRPWPAIGPDIQGFVNNIPAKDRYLNVFYNNVNQDEIDVPNIPSNLKIFN